ncbi:MAG TPA: hypothetical protein VIH16_03740 [Bellilinea sp.]
MKPITIQANLLLTALTPISHHDPAVQDGSNVLTFNRQKQLIAQSGEQTAIGPEIIEQFSSAHPVPADLAPIVADMPFAEFAACALIKLLIDTYNSQDGTGLFSGMERYSLLESRARTAAVKSSNLRSFWSNITRDLQLPIQLGREDELLIGFFALPGAAQFAVINQIATEHRTIITVARVWSAKAKMQNEAYAQAVSLPLDESGSQTAKLRSPELASLPASLVLDVPAVSANSLRHQIVREPGWLHLFGALDLAGETLPVEAEAIFYNGGNIRAGAKQPSGAFALARKARKNYPLLDLLGGVCDSFDLGESLLSVSAWLVCRENHAALSGMAAELSGAAVSAFDLLDDITHTRQATEQGAGQMIYNFEALVPGAQFVVRLSLKPYADQLAIGALAAALQTYLDCHPVIAGQSARGYGVVSAGWLERPNEFEQARDFYETYLAENHDQLRRWILDGTLGTGAKVVS